MSHQVREISGEGLDAAANATLGEMIMTTPRQMISASEWIEAGETFVTAKGHKIAYHRSGKGPPIVLLHGFPTWSYDYAEVATDLARDHDVVTLDFLGYGASDKPRGYEFSVAESADIVEALLGRLGIAHATLVLHDYGGIVGQELLDRRARGVLSFAVDAVHVLNNGIVYAAYRPTRSQKLLLKPVIGWFIARNLTKEKMWAGLNSVWGKRKLSRSDFDQIWLGMNRNEGMRLAHRHIRYNAERAQHHERWEKALMTYDGPLQLIWGLADPVSGKHVLDLARPRLPHARITELKDVGHFPQAEAPAEVAAAIRGGLKAAVSAAAAPG